MSNLSTDLELLEQLSVETTRLKSRAASVRTRIMREVSEYDANALVNLDYDRACRAPHGTYRRTAGEWTYSTNLSRLLDSPESIESQLQLDKADREWQSFCDLVSQALRDEISRKRPPAQKVGE